MATPKPVPAAPVVGSTVLFGLGQTEQGAMVERPAAVVALGENGALALQVMIDTANDDPYLGDDARVGKSIVYRQGVLPVDDAATPQVGRFRALS